MNAGGIGGPHATALTSEGATEIFAANVLGHVVLLEELLAAGALAEVAVLTGSEAARGSPSCYSTPSFVDGSVDECRQPDDGSSRRPNPT